MAASREEHMRWVKERSLAELDLDPYGSGPQNALGSAMSDLRKHPETRQYAGIELTMMLIMAGHLTTADQVRKHIEGFQ
jgi:hypothetical protein